MPHPQKEKTMYFYIFCIFVGLLAFDFTEPISYIALVVGLIVYYLTKKLCDYLYDVYYRWLNQNTTK